MNRSSEKRRSVNRGKEERNILQTIKRSKTKLISHILHRNFLLKHVTEGKIDRRTEVTGRKGRKRKQLLYGRTEETRYCIFKKEALARPLWRTRFGRRYGPVIRQTTE